LLALLLPATPPLRPTPVRAGGRASALDLVAADLAGSHGRRL